MSAYESSLEYAQYISSRMLAGFQFSDAMLSFLDAARYQVRRASDERGLRGRYAALKEVYRQFFSLFRTEIPSHTNRKVMGCIRRRIHAVRSSCLTLSIQAEYSA